MKKFMLCLMVMAVFAMVSSSQVFANTDLKAKAEGFIAKLNNATPVSDDENKIGFNIKSVKKLGDDYIVSWNCSNSLIEGNSNNQTFALTQIYYIDPEDYANNYQPFTINGDSISFNFEAGDEISMTTSRIKFEPKSKVMFVYFVGVGSDGPPELYTVPLFYTLVLGDEPYVLENTPRRANDTFDAALAK